MASFDELKAKYQSVLQVVQNKQVHMANLHIQDDKLFMKGTAPSQEAANAVWDEIKRINPRLDDIYRKSASSSLAIRTNTCAFSRLTNRDKLKDPNKIQVGQELKIPAA